MTAAANGGSLQAALELIGRGHAVLPVHTIIEGKCSCGSTCDSPGKHPANANGSRGASSDEKTVRGWWKSGERNLGVATGTEHQLVVLDVDADNGGLETLARLEDEHGRLPITPTVATGGGGWHFWFLPPDDRELRNSASSIGPGVDVRARGGYVVSPPSVHVSGNAYTWRAGYSPADVDVAELPLWLLNAATGPSGSAEPFDRGTDGKVVRGQRNSALASFAGTLRRAGADEQTLTAALRQYNLSRLDPPLGDSEVVGVARSVGRYEPHEPTPTAPEVEPQSLEQVVAAFREYLHVPDHRPLLAVLGAVAANYLPGDPCWLLLVGPPSSGKTELLGALGLLPDVHTVSTLTEGALLSGTSKREKSRDADGGLLRAVGDSGIVALKDFTSILSAQRDTRATTLAALREIYDGSWTRRVGTDGGRALTWQGHVGLVAGVTPVYDRHYAVIGALGDRFLLFRLPELDPVAQVHRALSRGAQESAMRRKLAESVAGLFTAELAEPPVRSRDETEVLTALATLVVRCRSSVERDGHSREVELIPPSEAPARFAVQLDRLLAGLKSIGASHTDAWATVMQTALDSMPQLKRVTLEHLLATDELLTTAQLAGLTAHPSTTVRRALEDLTGHGVVECDRAEKNQHRWRVADWARSAYGRATRVPETSGDSKSAHVPDPTNRERVK